MHQDYLNFSSDEHFDLITMIYCDFCVLSHKQRKHLLKKFHNLLKTDGAILLDVYSINQFNETKEKATYEHSSDKDFWSSFWADKPYFVFANTFKYSEEQLFLDKYRTREIFNWIKCYDLASIKQKFKECGLNIVESYANISGESDRSDYLELAIIAKKISLLCVFW